MGSNVAVHAAHRFLMPGQTYLYSSAPAPHGQPALSTLRELITSPGSHGAPVGFFRLFACFEPEETLGHLNCIRITGHNGPGADNCVHYAPVV